MHVRVCRECGEEYRPEISVCTECGGALEDRYDEPEARAPLEVGAPPVLPFQGGHRVVYSSPRPSELEPLARRLGAARIPFLVRGDQGFELLVPEPELERALKELEPLLGPATATADGDFDPERGYGRCPACRTELAPGAKACPACGLAFGSEEEPHPCPRCGAACDSRGGACRSCGFWGT